MGLPDDIINELSSNLQEYIKNYSDCILVCNADPSSSSNDKWLKKIKKLLNIWESFSSSLVDKMIDTILDIYEKSPFQVDLRVFHWILGQFLLKIIAATSEDEFHPIQISELGEICFRISMDSIYRYQETGNSGGFFSFKSSNNTNNEQENHKALDERLENTWSLLLGKLSRYSLRDIQDSFQRELNIKALSGAKENLIRCLRFVELNLPLKEGPRTKGRYSDATHLLHMLQSLMSNQNKSGIRIAALQVTATIIKKELLNNANLQRGINGSNEWRQSLSDLHTVATKFTAKKDYAFPAWELRMSCLCISSQEIFNRRWKDDVQSLLKFHYLHKDPQSLDCIGFFLQTLFKRHALSRKVFPLEKDIMEIIHTTQAWCFGIPKQKNLRKFIELTLSPLVEITLSIASYDMNYAIQSHIKELLSDEESVFSERKLIGLESLRLIFTLPQRKAKLELLDLHSPLSNVEHLNTQFLSFQDVFDGISHKQILLKHQNTLSEVISHILVESNSLYGTNPLNSSSLANNSRNNEYRSALALEIFRVAISLVPHVYESLELKDDQKMMIFSQCATHSDYSLRLETANLLKTLVRDHGELAIICKGIAEYIIQNNDDECESLQTLLDLLRDLVCEGMSLSAWHTWASSRQLKQKNDMRLSLLLVESMCLHLLCDVNTTARTLALELLQPIREVRHSLIEFEKATGKDGYKSMDHEANVLDIIEGIDKELLQLCPESFPKTNVLLNLAREVSCDSYFRWSQCLCYLSSRIFERCPSLAERTWQSINSHNQKFEPVLGIGDELEVLDAKHLAKWRNYAIVACSCAINKDDGGSNSLPPPTISSSSIRLLIKRLSRFLNSPSRKIKQAAVLAIGNTHHSSHELILEELSKYELLAFSKEDLLDTESSIITSTIGSGGLCSITPLTRRSSKAQKNRHTKASSILSLQWSLGRCYRALLESLKPNSWSNKELRQKIFQFTNKLHDTIDLYHKVIKSNSFLYMIHQDFCSILQCIVHQSSDVSNKEEEDNTESEETSTLTVSQRMQYFTSLLTWCRNTPNEIGGSKKLNNQEWTWPEDEDMSKGNHDSICSAYSAMVSLLIGRVFHDDVLHSEGIVYQWINDALNTNFVDSNSMDILCKYARDGLSAVIQNNIETVPLCIERCFFESYGTKEFNISRQYLHVLATLSSQLSQEFRHLNVLPSLINVCLLHLSDEIPQVRRNALILLQMVIPSQDHLLHHSSCMIVHPGMLPDFFSLGLELLRNITDEMQKKLSSTISTLLPNMGYQVMYDILSRLHRVSLEIQHRLIDISIPWIGNISLELHSLEDRTQLLQGMFNSTKSLKIKQIKTLWIQLVQVTPSNNLACVVEYIFQRMQTAADTQTSKMIISWIAQARIGLEGILSTVILPLLNRFPVQIQQHPSPSLSSSSPNSSGQTQSALVLLSEFTCYSGDHIEILRPVVVRILHVSIVMMLVNNVLLEEARMNQTQKQLPPDVLAWYLSRKCCALVVRNVMNGLHLLPDETATLMDSILNSEDTTRNFQCDEIHLMIETISKKLTTTEVRMWAGLCSEWFNTPSADKGERLLAHFSMKIFRLIQPTFEGQHCLSLLTLLHRSLSDAEIQPTFLLEMLNTMTSLVHLMPPSKLVLYPQLLWVSVALLNHFTKGEEKFLHLATFELLVAIFQKPSIRESIVIDVILARKPPQWTDEYSSIQRLVINGLNESTTFKIAIQLLEYFVVLDADPILVPILPRLVMCGTALLPYLCDGLNKSTNDNSQQKRIALDMSYGWEVEHHMELAGVFSMYAQGKYGNRNEFLQAISPLFMAVATPRNDFYLFQILLDMLKPSPFESTINVIQSLLQLVNWKTSSLSTVPSNASLLARLVKVLLNGPSRNIKNSLQTLSVAMKNIQLKKERSKDEECPLSIDIPSNKLESLMKPTLNELSSPTNRRK